LKTPEGYYGFGKTLSIPQTTLVAIDVTPLTLLTLLFALLLLQRTFPKFGTLEKMARESFLLNF
jgi:hypothetical protein